jgi:hypothetical protein
MAVDRKTVIDAMSRIRVVANGDGIIPTFGVFVNQLPVTFWNTFSERLTRQVGPDMLEAAEFLLVNAATECGYHTGHGIIVSEEWKAVVAPMVETPADVLDGLFAVITSWGWGRCEVVDLTPGRRMVVRAYEYYESGVVTYGASSKKSAYMLRGVSAAFMDVAYGGEYTPGDKNCLDKYECEQTRGIECGDDYGEFIVTRRNTN